MKNKKMLFILIMLLAGLLITSLDAQVRRPRALHNLRFGLHLAEQNLYEARMVLRLKDEIALTAEQEKKIEGLMLAYEEVSIKSQADIKILETRLASSLNDPKANRKELEKMIREIGKQKTDLEVDHLNYLLNIRDTLTPEQIQKLEKMRNEMRHGLRERFMERRQGKFPAPQQNS